jgi:hypothetical protein
MHAAPAWVWPVAVSLLVAALSPLLHADEPRPLLDALPAEVRTAAAALLSLQDAEARATAVRDLAQAAGEGALPVLVHLAAHDPSPRVRERSLRSLRGMRDPVAVAALESAARGDPVVDVSLRALEELHTMWAHRMVQLADARLAELREALPASLLESDAPDRDSSYAALLAAQEHWLVVAHGALLPAFLRQAPPVFEVLPNDRSVRIVAFGDFGSGESDQLETAAAIARLHAREPLDFGITLGDNFYPRGVASPRDPLWDDAWTKPYAGLGIRFYASLGNHDWGLPDSPAAEILYTDPKGSFQMPAARYTYTAGPAQLFVLDTTALSAAQVEWLDRELARSTARWRIVYGHHPIRSNGRYGDNATFVAELLPVLAGRVDLYLAGHEHDMQVLSPEDGVHFVISGAGGKSIRETSPGPTTRFAASAFGFTVLDIDAERIRVRMLDQEPRTLYEMEIVTPPETAPRRDAR